jgi:hypothetical protein
MTRRASNPPAFDGTRDVHDYSQDAKVPPPYQVIRRFNKFALMKPDTEGKLKTVFTCRAESEMGCHRESVIYLASLKKKKYARK